METIDSLQSFFETLLHRQTTFTIKRVFGYDTYPGHSLLAAHTNFDSKSNKNVLNFDDKWQEKFQDRFLRFKNNLEYQLLKKNLLDNKIAVELEFKQEGFREGWIGTILWCHKDLYDGFFFECARSPYVKDNLNIEFNF